MAIPRYVSVLGRQLSSPVNRLHPVGLDVNEHEDCSHAGTDSWAAAHGGSYAVGECLKLRFIGKCTLGFPKSSMTETCAAESSLRASTGDRRPARAGTNRVEESYSTCQRTPVQYDALARLSSRYARLCRHQHVDLHAIPFSGIATSSSTSWSPAGNFDRTVAFRRLTEASRCAGSPPLERI